NLDDVRQRVGLLRHRRGQVELDVSGAPVYAGAPGRVLVERAVGQTGALVDALVRRSDELGAAPIGVSLEDQLAAGLALLPILLLVDLVRALGAPTSARRTASPAAPTASYEAEGAESSAPGDGAAQRRPPANKPPGP